MAWGLEARVPFLDKAFLEVAMNIDPAEKQFSKGSQRQLDADGRPRMEKARRHRTPPPLTAAVHPPQGVRRRPARSDALPARRHPLAPEGAVLRRRRLQLDRRPQGARRGVRVRRQARRRLVALPGRHARHQGGLHDPRDVRELVPVRGRRLDRRSLDPARRLGLRGGSCVDRCETR